MLGHGLFHAPGKVPAKARQRDGSAGSGPVCQGPVQSQSAQDKARHHVAREDSGGGQASVIDEQLAQNAEGAAHQKDLCVFPNEFHAQASRSRTRAWQMPGMLSPCWALVGDMRAPVAAKSTRCQTPSSMACRM